MLGFLDPWQEALLDAFFAYWGFGWWPLWGWGSPFNWWSIGNWWFSPWWWWGYRWNPWWVNTITPIRTVVYRDYVREMPTERRLSYDDYLLRRIENLEDAASKLIEGLVQQGQALKALSERIEGLEESFRR